MGIETFAGTYIDGLNAAWPLGSDGADTLDSHCQGIKLVLQNTFPNVTGAVTSTHAELNVLDGITSTTTQLNLLNGATALSSTDDVIDNFPATTTMVFRSSSAPTGWTKGATHNDKAFRVITGSVTDGGSNSFTTALNSAVTSSSEGSHTHGVSALSVSNEVTGSAYSGYGLYNGVQNHHNHTLSGSTDAGSSHSHTTTLNVQYIDVILGAKD